MELRDRLGKEIFRHQLSWKRTEWGSFSCCSAPDCDWEFGSDVTFEQHVADVVLAMARVQSEQRTVQTVLDWLIGEDPPKSMAALVGQLMSLRDFGTRWIPEEYDATGPYHDEKEEVPHGIAASPRDSPPGAP